MEKFSSSTLVARQRSFQDHNSSLDSFSTNPTHSCQHCSQPCREHHNTVDTSEVLTNTIECTYDYNSSIYPSLSQQAALSALREFDNKVVLAWLTELRSSRLDRNHWFQPASLSSQLCEAISVLQSCSDSLVSAWLDFSRGGGAFDGPPRLYGSSNLDTQRANAALLHNSWQGSSSTSRSSVVSLGAPRSLSDGYTVPTTPTSSLNRDTYLDISREPSIDDIKQSFATGHSHWCFICENPRVITTCDGWKRHMKEHMTRYRCMPRGPIEHTTDGAKCAFCGFHNPTQGHCDTHKAYTCANKSLDARSYTRKTHLLTHLKTHYISDGVELADHWRDRINKRHFSCGFCVSHFHTLTDQLNHIDIAHYRLFQHVREWDFNKVIRGLLLQPGVDGSWRRILASHPYLIESLFHWDFSGVKRLKSRLEMSDEPADTLAEAAFIESKYHWSRQGEAETIDATRLSYHGDADAPQPKPATQAAAPIPFDSSESTAADGESMTSSAPHSEQAGWPWAVPDTPISHRIHSLSRVDSDMSEGTLTLDMQHPYRNTGQTFSTSGGNIRTQPQAGSYTSCASPNTLYPNSATSSRVMEGDCWPATPILDPAKSSSLISSQPKQQNRRSVAKARNMFTNQHSSLTSGHHVSPSTQTSIPLAKPSHVSQPRKQPSRSKLKDHYDINTEADMDLDLDVLQRLMRDEESTRSEKRSR